MSTDERSPESPSTALHVVLVAVALLVLAYAFLIATQPLLGVTVVSWLVGFYLLWRFFRLAVRFVRAVERIADSLERGDARI